MPQPTSWERMQKQTGKQPSVVKGDLTGKTVCVLGALWAANLAAVLIYIFYLQGANTGIGFETVKHFASMNAARIILACRSAARGEEALYSSFFFIIFTSDTL